MKFIKCMALLTCFSSLAQGSNEKNLQQEIQRLKQETAHLQMRLNAIQKNLPSSKSTALHKKPVVAKKAPCPTQPPCGPTYHESYAIVHAPDLDPESVGFYPTALMADDKVLTYIAGTPVVGSPYLGARPAFDGSDYIVNISSINRDIRLMQQRRRLYRAYQDLDYPMPSVPIIALSGKAEPIAVFNSPYRGNALYDITLSSSELDVAAALNQSVEAYMSIAYDESPPAIGPRVNNSAFNLNMGFVNIGNLDCTPIYFTAGQLYVPFGRYSSALISAPLPLQLARTKTRPFILGYKSQADTGPFAAIYGYRSETILGKSGVGGVNLGYVFDCLGISGEFGGGYVSSINDAAGMQSTGSIVGTTFGGFGSLTNGTELVKKIPAANLHANARFDRYNFIAEWVGAMQPFRPQDLSFNDHGAKPQAAQGEVNVTFWAFNRPASLGASYQWSDQGLALNLPKHRMAGVFSISIWKDTVESLEYRHDIDYALGQYGNGAAPIGFVNEPTLGTGGTADNVSLRLGVYF